MFLQSKVREIDMAYIFLVLLDVCVCYGSGW